MTRSPVELSWTRISEAKSLLCVSAVYVFVGSTSSRCGNEYTWPDLDDDVVCGDCIVLVRHMDT